MAQFVVPAVIGLIAGKAMSKKSSPAPAPAPASFAGMKPGAMTAGLSPFGPPPPAPPPQPAAEGAAATAVPVSTGAGSTSASGGVEEAAAIKAAASGPAETAVADTATKGRRSTITTGPQGLLASAEDPATLRKRRSLMGSGLIK